MLPTLARFHRTVSNSSAARVAPLDTLAFNPPDETEPRRGYRPCADPVNRSRYGLNWSNPRHAARDKAALCATCPGAHACLIEALRATAANPAAVVGIKSGVVFTPGQMPYRVIPRVELGDHSDETWT